MTEILVGAFVRPSIRLLLAHPRIISIIKQAKDKLGIGVELETDLHESALSRCTEVRAELVEDMHCMLTCMVFGVAFPLLLIAAPLFCWSEICVLRWVATNKALAPLDPSRVDDPDGTPNTQGSDGTKFAHILASNLLVRQPIRPFFLYSTFGILFVGTLLMYDLEFDLSPSMLLIAGGAIAVVITLRLLKWEGYRSLDMQSSSLYCKQSKQQNIVWFNPSGQVSRQRHADAVIFNNQEREEPTAQTIMFFNPCHVNGPSGSSQTYVDKIQFNTREKQ